MRHGRKSRSKKFNGYKRHIAALVGQKLIAEAFVRAANEPEHKAGTALMAAVKQHGEIQETLIDHGYLSSQSVIDFHEAGKRVRCKPWKSRNGRLFSKEKFSLQLDEGQVTCPSGKVAKIGKKSRVARFRAQDCDGCLRRQNCTRAKAGRGRSISIHPQENLLIKLRADQKDPEARKELRKRTVVEHSLARLGAIQGRHARYKGTRMNTLDARRCACIVNLQVIQKAQLAA